MSSNCHFGECSDGVKRATCTTPYYCHKYKRKACGCSSSLHDFSGRKDNLKVSRMNVDPGNNPKWAVSDKRVTKATLTETDSAIRKFTNLVCRTSARLVDKLYIQEPWIPSSIKSSQTFCPAQASPPWIQTVLFL